MIQVTSDMILSTSTDSYLSTSRLSSCPTPFPMSIGVQWTPFSFPPWAATWFSPSSSAIRDSAGPSTCLLLYTPFFTHSFPHLKMGYPLCLSMASLTPSTASSSLLTSLLHRLPRYQHSEYAAYPMFTRDDVHRRISPSSSSY